MWNLNILDLVMCINGFIAIYSILPEFERKQKLTSISKSNLSSKNIDIKTIRKISYNETPLLGRGNNGTMVYRGKFDDRDVAVKRVLNTSSNLAKREIEHLRKIDNHPNIVRYFYSEQNEYFTYAAMELCECNLKQYVQNKSSVRCIMKNSQIFEQITKGLQHLHTLQIIHRDLKPENVLVTYPKSDNERIVMISDFDLSKEHTMDNNSLSRNSEGWNAPELNEGSQITKAVDMFSLGCIFYYVLSAGFHPFGNSSDREYYIKNDYYKLDKLKMQDEFYKPLIKSLITHEPDARPTCKIVLGYPCFWKSIDTSIIFIGKVSGHLFNKNTDHSVFKSFYEKRNIVIGDNWMNHIDQEVVKILNPNPKKKQYDGTSINDLVRAIRNKTMHHIELCDADKKIFSSTEKKFFRTFLLKFPLLFIHTWISMQVLRKAEAFEEYYMIEDYIFHNDLIEYKDFFKKNC